MVGVILVVGLLITPAATAYLLSDRLNRMMVLAGLFGVTSVVGGLYLSIWMDSAGGGAIVVFCTLQFVVVLFVAPRYGILADWMRRRSMVPQQIVEDILKSILKGKGERMSPGALTSAGLLGGKPLTRAIQFLTAEGLIVAENSSLMLTDKGRREAIRVQRAHRLWESYLDHVGTPSEEIHNRAHQLEHVRDDESVEYLSHVLGHPEQDPHGSTIPQSEEDLSERGRVQLSVLRTGQRATVLSIDPLVAENIPLSSGDEIVMGERRDNGETWVVVGPGQAEWTLDHASCDRILVAPR
jgi:manganese/iron transport system permease protein/iron/zinc/copper transport system permease protein